MASVAPAAPSPRPRTGRRAARRADVRRGLDELGFVIPRFDDMQTYGRMKFLYDCVVQHAPENARLALEIGVYKACSTVFLGKACERRGIPEIVGVDLFTGTPSWGQTFDTMRRARIRLARYGLAGRVRLVRSHSQELAWTRPIDVLHIDGDHGYDAVRADIHTYAPHLAEGGIIVFDDYDLSHCEVRRAVHELLASRGDLHVVATNWQAANGSLCVKRVTRRR